MTGGIATGKSTVSKMLQKMGAIIIDADLVARQIVEPGKKAWQEIIETFSKEYLNQDQTLDRKKLGDLVFNNPQALEKLNAITHPLIVQEINRQIDEWKNCSQQPALLVIDAALLIEVRLHLLVEEIWVVTCSQEEQITRLMTRNNFSYQEALARIKSQMSLDAKAAYAQQIINNNGSLVETERQVEELWQQNLHRDN